NLEFTTTDDADFAFTLDLTDNETHQAWDDAADMAFTVQITECGTARLTAKTADGTITRPADNQLNVRFTAAQMRSLRAGETYRIGGIWVDGDGNTTHLFSGSVAVVDGGLA